MLGGGEERQLGGEYWLRVLVGLGAGVVELLALLLLRSHLLLP